MQIYIPSSGRAAEQHTLRQIPYDWNKRTFLVVPDSEFEEYHRHQGQEVNILSCPRQGIGPTRQWIVETAYPSPMVMFDDDLTFFRRRIDEPTKFEDALGADVSQMLDAIQYHIQDYASIGVCAREGGNRYPDQYYYNGRLLRVLAYKTAVLKEHGIRFDTIPVMEDFHVALSLLTKGYENLMLSNWCHNQTGSNAAGGCSQYRTTEVQRDAAHRLKEHFPDFVKVVTKTTKTAWGGQERTDVRVQWKKAYASSQ